MQQYQLKWIQSLISTTEVETVADDLNAGSFTNAGTEYDFVHNITTPSISGSTGSPDGFIVSVYNNLNDGQNVANNISAIYRPLTPFLRKPQQ